MGITWTSPSALWLLLAVPFVWLALRGGRTNFNRRQRILQAAVRSLLLAALALALARPVASRGSDRLSVVYLVDVSHSVSSKAITDAAARIDTLESELRPDHSRVMAFGSTVAVLDTGTAALRELAARDPADRTAAVERQNTDIDQALRQARAELLPGYAGRMVLFTDGRATAGDVAEAGLALAAAGVRVYVEPMTPRDIGDTWIDGVTLPTRLAAGGTATATVHVGSQRAGSARVELRAGDRVLGTTPAEVSVGVTAVTLDVKFPDPGAQRLEAVVTIAGDALAANNRFAREVVVGDRPRVLYIEGAMQSAKYLHGALADAGFDVTVRSTSALPQQAAELEPWDAMILSDVPRLAMSDASMRAMAQWVEKDGGGLFVAGGESVYGEGPDGGPGGYRNTELERIAPTTFERKDEPEVALIIVLDKSWSMAGAVMELCKAAAQAAIDVLDDNQSVGVVTFNDGLNWEVTVRNVGKHRDMIRKAIASIEPSGHTLIFPAVEQAYLALRDTRARAKHVVLLSDGRSYPDDYEGLVKKMVDSKMTVSSIAVGPAADVELLTNIAKWGKGRGYVVEDAKEVPQIFVKEAKNATNPSFDEKALKPVVKFTGFLEGIDFSRAPELRGKTATVLKDDALELLATEDGDPLLAFWPIGVGRTAVFASDVKDRWAANWLRWRGYGPFFAGVVRAIARSRPPASGIEVLAGPPSGGTRTVTVGIESRDAHGGYVDRQRPEITVATGDGRTLTRTARQVLPGRYETSIVADAAQPLVIRVAGAGPGGEAVSRLVIPDPAAEYRFRPADPVALQAIASATGGEVGSDPAAIRRASASQAARRALWPTLVFIALGVWLADIALRRVRLFERA